jgi:hypothetical protein
MIASRKVISSVWLKGCCFTAAKSAMCVDAFH